MGHGKNHLATSHTYMAQHRHGVYFRVVCTVVPSPGHHLQDYNTEAEHV